MPRSRAAIGLKIKPARPATRTPRTMPTIGGHSSPARSATPSPPEVPDTYVYVMAPTARKNESASDSWPLVPTNRFRPIAPTAAPKTANPARNQNSSTYSGSTRSTTRSTTRTTGRSQDRPGRRASPVRVRVAPTGAVTSDTGQFLRAEQAGRSDEEDDDHDDVGDDGAEAATQEQQRVLVAGGQGLGHPDQQAADERTAGGIQAAEDRRRERAEGHGVDGRADPGRGRPDEEQRRDGRQHTGDQPRDRRDPTLPDAHQGSGLAVLRRGAHRHAPAGVLE